MSDNVNGLSTSVLQREKYVPFQKNKQRQRQRDEQNDLNAKSSSFTLDGLMENSRQNHMMHSTCLSILHNAIRLDSRGGCKDAVDTVIDKLRMQGGDELVSNTISGRSSFGVNALHLAVYCNSGTIVDFLLSSFYLKSKGGALDIDAVDTESGWTALHRAIHFGYFTLIPMLLAAGASLTTRDSMNRSPIDLVSSELKGVLYKRRLVDIVDLGKHHWHTRKNDFQGCSRGQVCFYIEILPAILMFFKSPIFKFREVPMSGA